MNRAPILGQADQVRPGDVPVTLKEAIVWTAAAIAWVVFINAILPVVPQ